MTQCVWVIRDDIDSEGIWLKVVKADAEGALCEFKDPSRKNVYVLNDEVIRISNYDVR